MAYHASWRCHHRHRHRHPHIAMSLAPLLVRYNTHMWVETGGNRVEIGWESGWNRGKWLINERVMQFGGQIRRDVEESREYR